MGFQICSFTPRYVPVSPQIFIVWQVFSCYSTCKWYNDSHSSDALCLYNQQPATQQHNSIYQPSSYPPWARRQTTNGRHCESAQWLTFRETLPKPQQLLKLSSQRAYTSKWGWRMTWRFYSSHASLSHFSNSLFFLFVFFSFELKNDVICQNVLTNQHCTGTTTEN